MWKWHEIKEGHSSFSNILEYISKLLVIWLTEIPFYVQIENTCFGIINSIDHDDKKKSEQELNMYM